MDNATITLVLSCSAATAVGSWLLGFFCGLDAGYEAYDEWLVKNGYAEYYLDQASKRQCRMLASKSSEK